MLFRRLLLVCTFARCLASGLVFAAAGEGGNAIRCDSGKVYSWDYLNSQMGSLEVDPQIAKAKSAVEILKIIQSKIDKLNPTMAESLADFRKLNADPFSESSYRIWIKSKNPLVNLGDEYRRQLPQDCVKSAGPDFTLIQAVIRSTPAGRNDGVVLYSYDPVVFQELERTSPVQLSYLYVHEWLRDYTKSPEALIFGTQLLHSSKRLTPFQFANFMESIGFNLEWPAVAAGEYQLESGGSLPPQKMALRYDAEKKLRITVAFKDRLSVEFDAHNVFQHFKVRAEVRFAQLRLEDQPIENFSGDTALTATSFFWRSACTIRQKGSDATKKECRFDAFKDDNGSGCLFLNVTTSSMFGYAFPQVFKGRYCPAK